MNLGDYIISTYGKKIDFDNYAGAQCVDLIRHYCKFALEIPQPEPTGDEGAFTFFSKHNQRPVQKQYLDCVEVCAVGQNIPSGAIVAFRPTLSNKFGHIGICVRVDGSLIYLLEQDGFKQDGVKISVWTYSNVLGYLAKKEA